MDPALERLTLAAPVHIQVLTMLGFMVTGTYQMKLANRWWTSHTTISSFTLNVIGAIDCTQILIGHLMQMKLLLSIEKQFHSITVQFICDADMALENIVA